MSTRYSRYFQTSEFIFRFSKRILAFLLLVPFVGLFTLQKYHIPEKLIEGAAVAKERTNILFIENHETLFREQLRNPIVAYNERGITNSENYCEISACESIKCSSIPATDDPGNITSEFIQSAFKVRCPTTNKITLIYEGCKFPSNTVRKDWLKIDLSIKQLTFEECLLNHIHDDAFSEKIFAELEVLSLLNNRISSLNRSVFSKLVKLKQLSVQNNILDYAESDLLANFANSLEVLQLDGVINEREVLRNITGRKILSNLKTLSIRYNIISVLGPELFTGVPNVVSLFIYSSKVKEIRLNSFGPMSDSLSQLFLHNNEISTLPNGIFNIALVLKKQFNVYLTDNIWHCDCELQWMQEFIRRYPSAIRDVPRCTTPEINAQLSFVEARFCNENKTETTTQTVETTSEYRNDSSTDGNTIDVVCNGIVSNNYQPSKIATKAFPYVDYKFRTRFRNFTLTELKDGTVLVVLPDLEREGATLLWFDNQMQEDTRRSIHCARNVKESYLLKDTSPRTRYTVCLSDNQEDGFSPLNCLGITTKPGLEDRAWLTNKYKTVVCLISSILLLLLCAISALCTFISVRRHPSLLRGSKRVILVKRRNLEAIILPKGAKIDDGEVDERKLEGQSVNKRSADTKYYTEDGYVTPIPPNKFLSRKDSRISGISFQSYGASYVSGIEPAFWRWSRPKSEIAVDEAGPPPLPPYPKQVIPSVSMAIDSIDAKNDENDLNEIM